MSGKRVNAVLFPQTKCTVCTTKQCSCCSRENPETRMHHAAEVASTQYLLYIHFYICKSIYLIAFLQYQKAQREIQSVVAVTLGSHVMRGQTKLCQTTQLQAKKQSKVFLQNSKSTAADSKHYGTGHCITTDETCCH